MASVGRVLFLDVDGVLHPFHGHLSESQITTFHRDCMTRLQSIIDKTNCEIVLSSSWRNFGSTRARLLANLAEYGMSFTRWIEPDSSTSPSPSAGKVDKILSFVQHSSPAAWVVVDDEDLIALSNADKSSIMMQLFTSRFVKTDPGIGIQDSDVGRICEILSD